MSYVSESPKRIRKKFLCFLIVSLFFTQGCVSIFRTQTQRDVKITTENEDPDTRVTVLTKEDTGAGSITTDLEREHSAHQAVLMKDGYKDAYRVIYSDKFPAATVVCLIFDAPFFLAIFPAASELNDETRKKFWDFRDPYYLEPPQVEIPEKDSAQRYLVHQSTSVDLGKDDTSYVEYEDPEAYENGAKPEDVGFREDSVKGENVLSSSSINDLLVDIGYQDTSSSDDEIVLNDYNSVNLSSSIDRFLIRRYGKRGNYFNTEITVNWEFKNNYDETIYDTTLTTVSGDFSRDYTAYGFYTGGDSYKERAENIREAKAGKIGISVMDALEKSLIDLVQLPKVDKLLEEGTQKSEKKDLADLSTIQMKEPSAPPKGSMNQQMKGVVTIEREDGHGSGCIVSEDGYMLTNFHVVSGADSVDVLFDPNTKVQGSVERESRVMDLALVKLDTSGLQPLKVRQNNSINVGSDVMAIGTPENIQLGQSVSKGIISGKREFNDVKYIQTDVSINAGNSGGALIDKESGELIGLVTAKMFGLGVEGIGFAVPANLAFEKLNIEYE